MNRNAKFAKVWTIEARNAALASRRAHMEERTHGAGGSHTQAPGEAGHIQQHAEHGTFQETMRSPGGRLARIIYRSGHGRGATIVQAHPKGLENEHVYEHKPGESRGEQHRVFTGSNSESDRFKYHRYGILGTHGKVSKTCNGPVAFRENPNLGYGPKAPDDKAPARRVRANDWFQQRFGP